MADDVKETSNVTEQDVKLTDAQALEQIEKEINVEMVKRVEDIINPPEVEEIKDEKKDEVKKEKPAEEVKEDKKEEIVEVKSDSDPEKEEKEETTKAVTGLNLPNRLLQAAKRNHVSDEKILELGETAEFVLGKLADASDAVSERLGELGRKAKSEFKPSKKEDIKISTLKLPEDFDSEAGKQLQETINALTAKITCLETALQTKERESTLISSEELDKKIDSFFDKVEYPEFGKTEVLTKAELVMRQNVWEKADDIIAGGKLNGQKVSLDEALEQAMSIYEGKNPRKVREKLVDEVSKREKQQISRATSKKQVELQGTNDDKARKAVKDWFDKRDNTGW